MKVTFFEHTYYSEKIREKPVLIDLGSCKGGFATHFKANYPDSTIIMVEPCRSNFPAISLAGEGVSKIWAAASGKSGQTLTFYEDLRSEQNGSCLFNYFNGVPYEVTTVSLDDLVKPFDQVDLVKIDVEGAEWDIIENLSMETMDKIKQMTIEFHDFLDPSLASKSENAVKKLKANGFNVDYNPTTYMHGSKYYDSLFYKV